MGHDLAGVEGVTDASGGAVAAVAGGRAAQKAVTVAKAVAGAAGGAIPSPPSDSRRAVPDVRIEPGPEAVRHAAAGVAIPAGDNGLTVLHWPIHAEEALSFVAGGDVANASRDDSLAVQRRSVQIIKPAGETAVIGHSPAAGDRGLTSCLAAETGKKPIRLGAMGLSLAAGDGDQTILHAAVRGVKAIRGATGGGGGFAPDDGAPAVQERAALVVIPKGAAAVAAFAIASPDRCPAIYFRPLTRAKPVGLAAGGAIPADGRGDAVFQGTVTVEEGVTGPAPAGGRIAAFGGAGAVREVETVIEAAAKRARPGVITVPPVNTRRAAFQMGAALKAIPSLPGGAGTCPGRAIDIRDAVHQIVTTIKGDQFPDGIVAGAHVEGHAPYPGGLPAHPGASMEAIPTREHQGALRISLDNPSARICQIDHLGRIECSRGDVDRGIVVASGLVGPGLQGGIAVHGEADGGRDKPVPPGGAIRAFPFRLGQDEEKIVQYAHRRFLRDRMAIRAAVST